MVIRFFETEQTSSPEVAIWDYPLPTEEIGVSFQKLAGRGPREGKYLNTVCREMYFIISGSALFHIGDGTHEVGPRDVVVVEPNTPHYIEAGCIEYITITRPNWYEEQYRQVI